MVFGDQNALIFFKKQGFSNHIGLSVELWKPFVRNYNNGQMMIFMIDPQEDYLFREEMIQIQTQLVKEFI